MAVCNTNELLLSGKMFQEAGGGISRVLKLELLKQTLLALNPSADVSVNTLLDNGKCFAFLTPGEMRIIKLQLMCEILGGD